MSCLKKISDSLMSLGSVLLLSRPVGAAPRRAEERSLIVMGNGPSLRKTINEDFEILMKADRMAVNFAANAPDFFTLKPQHYVLADPHFFNGFSTDENVKNLWKNLCRADWPLTLHIPVKFRNRRPEGIVFPANISFEYFNLTPGEGFGWLTRFLYDRRLATPRPRNVMIPAIMEGLAMGYTRIWLVGADHTWLHTLNVDDKNRVVSVQPHFYKDSPEELDRVAEEYKGYHLHDILQSMTIAFRSYHQLEYYAVKKGVEIFNATEGAMIDAFKRRPLRDLT